MKGEHLDQSEVSEPHWPGRQDFSIPIPVHSPPHCATSSEQFNFLQCSFFLCKLNGVYIYNINIINIL